jgi:hypothetical protein
MLALLVIIFLLFSLKFAWWLPSQSLSKTRIMMYHMIAQQIPSKKRSGLRVSPVMFEKQLKWFSDND